MTVLISGAGIGGLTLGLSLHQRGIPFRIFEAVRELRPMGVGINLQPHAVRELFELGLKETLDEIGLRTEELAYFSAQGTQIWSEPRGELAGYQWPQYSLHRGKFQMALFEEVVRRCGAETVSTGAALGHWDDIQDGVEISLVDRGSGDERGKARGDVLIVAEGINSTARARLYPDEGPAQWGGTMMWRGVTKGPRFLTGRSVTMTGRRDLKFAAYPIADTQDGGSVINWIADMAMPKDYVWRQQDWNREGGRADFARHFEDWSFDWLDVPAVIENADGIWEFPMVDRDPLDQWTFGRMTLLGDAAHAMYPIGSNGASQCILDARHLTAAVGAHGLTPEALEAYEAERRPKVNALVLANRGDGPDKILDIAAARAPDGFAHINDIMTQAELDGMAKDYKAIAGMDVETLNARPSILES
ncbi:flavin-dependent oxidoreductase [uncultured Litoreibacter sp.]|uniref:flavin-dependent oxidoreductase n=1 Tax=uncultured Litoreibacter sp. TaxID=1392394 RepID=UPI0026390C38|nr:flavin-dependent oxidoreductase [uncultured Litoreibacter sp.]